MSKVLISFLGTSNKKREYRKAIYHFSDGYEEETSFIANALSSYYNIDKIILIGTVKSMWEEVYNTFGKDKETFSEDKYLELSEFCTAANHNSKLELPYKKDIENVLGNDSKIILIKYGLNEDEIQYNSSEIMSIEQYLDNGDELFVDITHSFRSLPLFLMNCLIYLQNVSKKKIQISHVTYGMLDVSIEMGYTPVVELNSVIRINEWISGAYAFSNFGNAYKIAELIKDEDKSAAERLNRFSDLMNLNHLSLIEKESLGLSAICNKRYKTRIPEMILNPILNDFIKSFKSTGDHSIFQFRLAKWQKEHRNYCAAYITLLESIITFVCEQNQVDANSFCNREYVKKCLRNKKNIEKPSEWNRADVIFDEALPNLFHEISITRNSLAHTLETEKKYQNMIKTLDSSIKKLDEIFNKKQKTIY